MDQQVDVAALAKSFGRGLGKFLVGGSVGRVVSQVVKNNVNIPTNRREAIRIKIATYAISGMVAGQATKWFEQEFDDLFVTLEKIKKSKNESENKTPTEGTQWKSSPETSNKEKTLLEPEDVQDPPMPSVSSESPPEK